MAPQPKLHTFDVDPHTFWQLYMLDRDFLYALYGQMKLNIEQLDIAERGEGDDLVVERTIQIIPEREMPGFLKKLVKGTSTVTQRERYDAAKGQMTIDIDVPVIGDRVDYGGTYTWEAIGEHQMRRHFVAHCHVRIPLVGRKIEAFFLDEIAQGVEAMAPLIAQWLRDQPKG